MSPRAKEISRDIRGDPCDICESGVLLLLKRNDSTSLTKVECNNCNVVMDRWQPAVAEIDNEEDLSDWLHGGMWNPATSSLTANPFHDYIGFVIKDYEKPEPFAWVRISLEECG